MDSSYTEKSNKLKDDIKHSVQARHFKKGRLGTAIYQIASFKNKRAFSCEGSIEKDYALRLEHDKNVIGYMCQPETFSLTILGKKTTYTPDFLVHYVDSSSVYIDTKPDSWEEDEELIDRLHAIKTILENKGRTLRVVTESQVRIEPLLTNIQLLYPSLHLCPDADYKIVIEAIKSQDNICKVGELRAHPDNLSERAIRKALFNGPRKHISHNIFNDDTIVELI